MAIVLHVSINLTKHTSDPLEALEFRHGFEDAISEYDIGTVVDAGTLVDGTLIDVTFETNDEEHARFFLKDYLEHCGVYADTKIETESDPA